MNREDVEDVALGFAEAAARGLAMGAILALAAFAVRLFGRAWRDQ